MCTVRTIRPASSTCGNGRHEHATPLVHLAAPGRWRRRCAAAGAGPGGNAAADAEADADADASAAAGATGRRSAGRRSGRDRARAQPVRADRPGALHRRPGEQHRRRPGALSALPGRPRRAAVLRLPLLVGAARRRLHLRRAREQRRLARSGVLRRVQPRRQDVGDRELAADPAVLQRGHDDALYGQRRHAGARRRGAARRPGWSGAQPLPPDRPAVRSARAARHRARRGQGHADAEARRHGQLHHAEARRRAAVRRQLRLQQRRRGGAALRLARQRLHHRHRVDEREEHAARRLQRIVVRQPRRSARLGQPAAHRRRGRLAGTRPHVAVALELGADGQLRRLHQAGAQDADHRVLLLRPVEQRRAAAAVHDQFGGADDCTPARQTRMPKRTCSRRP